MSCEKATQTSAANGVPLERCGCRLSPATNRSKRYPTTIQEAPSKKNPKTFIYYVLKTIENFRQNGPTSKSGGILGGLWGGFWVAPGSKAHRGSSRPPPGRLLGSFWPILKVFGAPLWRLSDRLGHQVGAPWAILEAFWKRPDEIF